MPCVSHSEAAVQPCLEGHYAETTVRLHAPAETGFISPHFLQYLTFFCLVEDIKYIENNTVEIYVSDSNVGCLCSFIVDVFFKCLLCWASSRTVFLKRLPHMLHDVVDCSLSNNNVLLVQCSGNTLDLINVVTLRQARLVSGWVTIFRRVNHVGAEPGTQAYSA